MDLSAGCGGGDRVLAEAARRGRVSAEEADADASVAAFGLPCHVTDDEGAFGKPESITALVCILFKCDTLEQ